MKKQHNKKAKRREQRQKRVIFLIAKTTKWNKILSWPVANISKGLFATLLLDANDIIIINSLTICSAGVNSFHSHFGKIRNESVELSVS